MSGLDVAVDRPEPSLTVLRLTGEFEGMSVLDAKDALLGHVASAEGTLLIDLAGIAYIDSSAIGVLLEMARAASARRLKFALLHAADPIRKVLAITKVDKILPVLDA